MQISFLYQQVYNGQYSNPLMREISLSTAFLADLSNVWLIAEIEEKIVGSIVFETDQILSMD
ncbi:MAG: hypothetical protein H7249_05985 [Chitinophagaceae bacterium]|nr:hypothetical protein [Oligoflexus sp.]